jgi:hypothetical protein
MFVIQGRLSAPPLSRYAVTPETVGNCSAAVWASSNLRVGAGSERAGSCCSQPPTRSASAKEETLDNTRYYGDYFSTYPRLLLNYPELPLYLLPISCQQKNNDIFLIVIRIVNNQYES